MNGAKKRLNFFYFQWPKVDQMRNEYLRSYQIDGIIGSWKIGGTLIL